MEDNVRDGIKYMLFASLTFAFMGGFAKLLSEDMSSVEVVFFRNFTGVVIIVYSIYKSPLNQVGGKTWLLIFRGLAGFVALLMYFYNIKEISLAEAQTFSKTSPIFTAIFAYIFVKEKLSLKAWLGVFVGFIGITFITGFDPSNVSKTDWLGILCGVGAGLAYTSIRELRKYYDGRAIVLSFMGIGTIGPVILMLIAEYYTSISFAENVAVQNMLSDFDFILAPFSMPEGLAWFYIVGLGVSATISQIYMTKAYSLAKGGIIGTISYANIIFSIPVGMILGDLFPSSELLIGIGLIVASGFLVSKK